MKIGRRGIGLPAAITLCMALAALAWADPATDANNEGIRLHESGKAREAIPYFDRAIRLNPRNAEAYTNRGIAWREKGDLSRAIADLDKAIKLNPKYARTYGDRGRTRLVQGKDAEAQQDVAPCFDLDPGM